MVQKPKRARGRPRSFDVDEVLDRAIPVFWAKGFDDTSLDDLSGAMGIARPSMYNAFGDKEALFLRCLERYGATVCAPPMRQVAEADAVEHALSAWLDGIVGYVAGDPAHPGCLIGNVGVVVASPEVRHVVADTIAATGLPIEARLQQGVDDGELPADYPVRRGARRAVNAMLALCSRARVGASVEELREDAADAVAAVLSCR